MSAIPLARKILQGLLIVIAVCWALDLQRRLGLQFFTEQFLAVVTGLSFAIVFLDWAEGAVGGMRKTAAIAFALTAMAAAFYIAWTYPTLTIRMAMRPLDAVAATTVIVLSPHFSPGWGASGF